MAQHCGKIFPDKLNVSLFPDRFQHYVWTEALSAHSDFIKGVCVFRCNLPPALSAEWPGLFMWGGTDTEEESAHKVNSEEENSPTTPAGIQTHFSITSLALLPTSYPGFSIIASVSPMLIWFVSILNNDHIPSLEVNRQWLHFLMPHFKANQWSHSPQEGYVRSSPTLQTYQGVCHF